MSEDQAKKTTKFKPPPLSAIWGENYESPVRTSRASSGLESTGGMTPGRPRKPPPHATSTPAQPHLDRSGNTDSGLYTSSINRLSPIRARQSTNDSSIDEGNDTTNTTNNESAANLPDTISPFRFQGLQTPNAQRISAEDTESSKLGPALLQATDCYTPTKSEDEQEKIEKAQELVRSALADEQKSRVVKNVETPEIICPKCGEIFTDPKVLACFHSFCTGCLTMDSAGVVKCMECQTTTQLDETVGKQQLISDYGLENLIKHCRHCTKAKDREESGGSVSFLLHSDDSSMLENLPDEPDDDIIKEAKESIKPKKPPPCTTCPSASPNSHKSDGKQRPAVARCRTCVALLCNECKKAHFSNDNYLGHVVTNINSEPDVHHRVKCSRHHEYLDHVCMSCNLPACQTCLAEEHNDSHHNSIHVKEMSNNCFDHLVCYMNLAQHKEARISRLRSYAVEFESSILAAGDKCIEDVDKEHQRVIEAVNEERERKIEMIEETKARSLEDLRQFRERLDCYLPKLKHTLNFTARLMRYGAQSQVAVFKDLLETRYNTMLKLTIPEMITPLHYASTLNFKGVSDAELTRFKNNALGQVEIDNLHDMGNYPFHQNLLECVQLEQKAKKYWPQISPMKQDHEKSDITSFENLVDNLYSMPRTDADDGKAIVPLNRARPSITDSPNSVQCPATLSSDFLISLANDRANHRNYTVVSKSYLDELTKNHSTTYYGSSANGMMPKNANISRHKMIYHLRFGEYGTDEGKFTEPSGVAVGNAPNNRLIYVADTNNHRIQAFERDGKFRFSFGECGKRDGQLLYPNRVAVCTVSGHIIVTERAPTHQIQVFSPDGQFVRKFGAYVLQHPRGVCVDSHQRIVVVECKIMRILIFSMEGQVLKKICCRPHLEFPNGVCTNEHEEIFVSDNRAHSVKVFNYDGALLRLIGGEGVTNYPIGVGINNYGQVVVADNHNNFNVTTFTQDGKIISAFESKLKHAQCFDVALTDEGSVVLASKDFKIYLYRYESSNNGLLDGEQEYDELQSPLQQQYGQQQAQHYSSSNVFSTPLQMPQQQKAYPLTAPYLHSQQQPVHNERYNSTGSVWESQQTYTRAYAGGGNAPPAPYSAYTGGNQQQQQYSTQIRAPQLSTVMPSVYSNLSSSYGDQQQQQQPAIMNSSMPPPRLTPSAPPLPGFGDYGSNGGGGYQNGFAGINNSGGFYAPSAQHSLSALTMHPPPNMQG